MVPHEAERKVKAQAAGAKLTTRNQARPHVVLNEI
jgi:hypothetical protein